MTYTETKVTTKESQQSSGQPVLSFDGKDDFIYFGKANPIKTPQGTFETPLNFSQTTTVECWIKLDSYKNNFIFSKLLGGDKPAIFYGIFIDEQKKIPMFIYSTTDKQNQALSEAWDIESAKINLNEWYHLAFVVSDQQVELFIDGESQGSMKLEANIADNPGAELFIGKSYSEDSYFSGQISEVRIWNTARTPDNLEENMSRPLENVNNKESSLIGYWMLNRGSEFTVCDSTSNDQYGIINGATWVTSEDFPVKPATPKQKFIYADNGLAMFDADKVLPAELQATTRWLANFHQSFKGIGGTVFHMGIMNKEKTPLPYMPANLTSLNPHKYSDEYFVERRLNGVNPGQLKRVDNQPWDYIIKYDFGNIEIDKFAIFSKIIEARFCLDGTKLNPHSIEYTLHGETEIQTYTPLDTGWERAKEIFRTAELVYHESRCHLGRTHINIDQYAMALYRNVVNNPIKNLLDPHFEGVLNINQRGGSNIIGFKTAGGTNVDGMIPDTSAISLEGLNTLLKEEISGLTYRNWSPREYTIPDYVENNYFDQAAIAMWNILTDYVKNFFEEYQQDIQEYWSEIEGMSADLSSHSILKPELGTLDIKTMHDLKQLCVYVIYMSSFYHSWVNMKQYEDGGDVEFGAMGLWEQVNPQENLGEFKQQFARKTRQSAVLLNLTSVRYNLIMDVGPTELKNAIWKQRHLIEPGLPLNNLLMSISI
jgi:linolenate 9R-lipoxygenase